VIAAQAAMFNSAGEASVPTSTPNLAKAGGREGAMARVLAKEGQFFAKTSRHRALFRTKYHRKARILTLSTKRPSSLPAN
jgi:hypothetical protein